MAGLADRLATVLATVLTTDVEPDGALTVHHEDTLASLRVVPITDELELVSLTQILGWDLALTKKLRDRAAEQARLSQLGTVTVVEKGVTKTADVLLRYNFPGSGLSDDALCTLVLLVLAKGVDIRQALTS
ncbi:hypothetical protein [Mycolicibacter kumamotonensis]|jgi:hypothetical protein|uniref:Uncharacterized protein n=1 Tax=Mycolicibacter kumamotonensis TaxID=354243 RepID=A0A1B8SFB8_9MYCO|nr:hypothetical protein [Mycolicibacter kumamotonensis]NDJ91719.1 hypothetical protein [Mycolicibacter kumamotonensis]OBY31419.1 hypothetical protein ACT18_12225 [Mycolicibacter kumamotonensis]ORA78531.1 hypothetical protein BST28_14300 [Mycolicibacter kumamotonensis]